MRMVIVGAANAATLPILRYLELRYSMPASDIRALSLEATVGNPMMVKLEILVDRDHLAEIENPEDCGCGQGAECDAVKR